MSIIRNETERPTVLHVCGSGVMSQAQTKAIRHIFQDLSCHAQTVSMDMFHSQWHTLLTSNNLDVVYFDVPPSTKINVESLKEIKRHYPKVIVILALTSVDKKADFIFSEDVLSYIDIITSNIIDIKPLIGSSADSKIADLYTLLKIKYASLRCHWLIKDNDFSQKISNNWLLDQDSAIGFHSLHTTSGQQQTELQNKTADILSASLSCFLAHGYDALDATTMATAYVKGTELVDDPGWPRQIEHLPSITSNMIKSESDKTQVKDVLQAIDRLNVSQPFAKMDLEKMGLYPVVDSVDWLDLVLKKGAKIAQLRIKNPKDPQLDIKIQQAIALGEKHNAQVFINDYWQQAIVFGAYGVHLGQEDLDIADLSKIQQAGLRLGISTHGYYEIARAQNIQPSYIALGHIFPTQTKDMPSQPQGLNRLNHYAQLLKDKVPTVAIGGISIERFTGVAKTGVDSVAVVSAITKADHPEEVTRLLLSTFNLVQSELTDKSVTL